MAKRQKSETRKLAELVARQRGIKVRSAQNWLYRISSGKVRKPKFGLTDYAKKKVRKFVKAKKAEKAKAAAPAPAPAPVERSEPFYNFKGSERITVPVMGVFNFYGTRNKKRLINFELFGDEANAFLNAPDPEAAAVALSQSAGGRFLQGADVEIWSFRLAGIEKDTGFWTD